MTRNLFWTITLVVLSAFVLIASKCSAAECLSSRAEVVRVHGQGAHSYWGYHVPGHDGERCYSRVPINMAALRGKDQPERKEVRPRKRQHNDHTKRKTVIADDASNGVALSVGVFPTPAESERIADWLMLKACLDYNVIGLNKLVDIAYARWMTENHLWTRSDEPEAARDTATAVSTRFR